MHIKESWRNHPLFLAGCVEMVPIAWLWEYWGRDVGEMADLKNGRIVTLDELWENILEEGLHDPLIVRVGIKNRKFRLEAGNHRIQVLYAHGVMGVPVTVQLRDECGPHVSDVMTTGTHNFDVGDELLVATITSEYMKPSDVFKSLSTHKAK